MSDESSLRSLHLRFDALWARVIGQGDPARPWRRLDAGYSSVTRAYHGWAHVAAMLTELDAVRADPEFQGVRCAEVELAVFFHDAVYDARRPDNEAASASLLAEEAGAAPMIGAEGIDRLRAMILATIDHRPSLDPATRLLCDLDLAILGAPAATYAAYAQAVRREYSHVPEPAWRFGRMAVLQRFLARERLYQSTCLAARYEAAARLNLKGELAQLAS